jgi:hypothetical protein
MVERLHQASLFAKSVAKPSARPAVTGSSHSIARVPTKGEHERAVAPTSLSVRP